MPTRPTTDVLVHCAQPLRDSDDPTPVLRIMAATPVPEFTGRNYEQHARDFYVREAEQLADALFAHLPGGTLDQLISAMLLRRASLFAVKF